MNGCVRNPSLMSIKVLIILVCYISAKSIIIGFLMMIEFTITTRTEAINAFQNGLREECIHALYDHNDVSQLYWISIKTKG